MTEKTLTLCEKLVAIQSELKAPKNQKNTFGGYNYRSAEDILEAVKPLLAKYDCALTLTDEICTMGTYGDNHPDLRFYIKATATIIDSNGADMLSTTAFAREPLTKKGMDDSQITGTASSYARKYALNGLFCIDDTKDADTDEYTKQTNKQKTVEEYIKLINDCEDEKSINNLFYEWSKVYPKGTADYNVLTVVSFDRKKQIVGA